MPSADVTCIALPDWQGDLHQVAALLEATWPHHYGPDGPGFALADVAARHAGPNLPWGVVALRGDRVVGTAALADTSFGAEPDEGPWLVGLAVTPDMRNRGIGTALVEACRAEAARRGDTAIYATTRSATGLMHRNGWQDLRVVGGWQVLRVVVRGPLFRGQERSVPAPAG